MRENERGQKKGEGEGRGGRRRGGKREGDAKEMEKREEWGNEPAGKKGETNEECGIFFRHLLRSEGPVCLGQVKQMPNEVTRLCFTFGSMKRPKTDNSAKTDNSDVDMTVSVIYPS
jgi:hypothetical protein